MDFSYKTMVGKGVKYVVIFLLPVLVNQFIVSYPEWAQLTVGGFLVMALNYLKVRTGIRLI